uniref:phenylalanine-tRNA ligase beta subunit n=1 Tax=Catenella fusiformis TaxID=3024791 RepID=UPI0027DA0D04|nr:phenylalanine-tRNA ligase beta subunit [Catenella fusiformis]WCH57614.1 phenylalanine-tRNA ligase beta subunit [Catenella fusiformis]
MKFSWKWLNHIIDLKNIPLNKIVHKLTLAGFEIENIEDKRNDKTLNISITANRSDTTSIVGIARELSCLFNINLHSTEYKTKSNVSKQNITNKIELIPSNLLDFQFDIIDQIDTQTSPKWLQDYLLGCDIIPQNTLADIKQYIHIKWGQEIEIFDAKKIDSTNLDTDLIKITNTHDFYNNVDTNKSKINKKSGSLEGLTYKNKTISIFGLRSNPNIVCDKDTSSVMILGYVCRINYVKTNIHQLSNRTDKSQTHIRGLSRYDFLEAYKEIVELVLSISRNSIRSIVHHQWHESPAELNYIEIHKKKIHNILGPSDTNSSYLTVESITEILQQLKFQPKYKDNIFFVTIPEHRSIDIKRPVDVIEEIGRIYGFNRFFDKLPINHKKAHTSSLNKLIKKIKIILRNLGLHEVVHYSIENTYDSNMSIKLYNPLLEDQTHLRNTLIYNLLNTLTHNYKHKNPTLECFEIGRVFQKQRWHKTAKKYSEYLHIGGLIGNTYSKTLWSEKGQRLSWFQAKGLLESLLEQLHTDIAWNPIEHLESLKNYSNRLQLYHPYRCAILQNQKTKEILGIFGELNLKYFKELNKKYNHYVFELDLIKLLKTTQINRHLNYLWKPYSIYPNIIRDISLTLNKKTKAYLIQEVILLNNNALVENVEILNEYYLINNIDQRNVNFRITYRSSIKTLNDYDVQNIDKDISSLLKIVNKIINFAFIE